jgi:DNA-directed RNA polymerase subunit beta
LKDTHAVICAEEDGEIIYVDGQRVKILYPHGIKEYSLDTFKKSNQKTLIHQKPAVSLAQKVKKGSIIIE